MATPSEADIQNVDIRRGEDDTTFALGAEAYAWCCPLVLAVDTALAEAKQHAWIVVDMFPDALG